MFKVSIQMEGIYISSLGVKPFFIESSPKVLLDLMGLSRISPKFEVNGITQAMLWKHD
jgi:hypothetical protein